MFKRREGLLWYQKLREWVWPRAGWQRMARYIGHRLQRISDSPYRIAAGLDGFHAGLQTNLSASLTSGFIQAFGNLSIASPRIKKSATPRRSETRHRREHFAHHLADRIGRNPALSLRSRQLGGVEPPQFAGVREVEISANGLAETALQHRQKSFLPDSG